MGRLRIMGSRGDQQIEWCEDDSESLILAEGEFTRWIARPGNLAFGFKRPSVSDGRQILSFDPELSEIILVPQMRGG